MMDAEMKSFERIAGVCETAFAGAGPAIQGAVLADLVSSYFAGHHPGVREEVIAGWLKTVRELIAVHPLGEAWGRLS